MKCQRCLDNVGVTIMSMFNTDIICVPCKTKETEHPDYERARKAEGDAMLNGNYNFVGIKYNSKL